MEVFFELQDQDDVIHNHFSYKFDSEATLKQFKTEIKSMCSIDHKHQRLYFENCEEIVGPDERSLQSCGVKHGCILIVRHSLANNWKEFLECFELAQQALKSKNISEIERTVDLAMDQFNALNEANFFVTFPRYFEVYRQFPANFSRYMNKEIRYMEYSMHDYFSKIYVENAEGSKLEIQCKKKMPYGRGNQGNMICHVSRTETLLGNYYVKHMGFSNEQQLDLREFFVYKLFELIKVGPAVHFIPYTHQSGIGLYIVTNEVAGFRRENSDGLSNEVNAQRDLLKRVMFLRLREQSYGIDGNEKLSIIDFRIRKFYADPEMVQRYLEKNQGSKELRSQVAKDCIQSWKLLESFDRANEEIVKQKELFEKYPISNRPTQNFDEYLAKIKNNLNSFVVQLN